MASDVYGGHRENDEAPTEELCRARTWSPRQKAGIAALDGRPLRLTGHLSGPSRWHAGLRKQGTGRRTTVRSVSLAFHRAGMPESVSTSPGSAPRARLADTYDMLIVRAISGMVEQVWRLGRAPGPCHVQ